MPLSPDPSTLISSIFTFAPETSNPSLPLFIKKVLVNFPSEKSKSRASDAELINLVLFILNLDLIIFKASSEELLAKIQFDILIFHRYHHLQF